MTTKGLVSRIRNSYSFICNLCIEKNIKLVEKFGKVNVTSKNLLEGIHNAQEGMSYWMIKIFLLYSI